MSYRGVIWGVIGYVVVWLMLVVVANLGVLNHEHVSWLLVLCQVLAGAIAAKNSSALPVVSAISAGAVIGVVVALAAIALSGLAAFTKVVFGGVVIAFYFGIGGLLWTLVSLLTKQGKRRL